MNLAQKENRSHHRPSTTDPTVAINVNTVTEKGTASLEAEDEYGGSVTACGGLEAAAGCAAAAAAGMLVFTRANTGGITDVLVGVVEG